MEIGQKKLTNKMKFDYEIENARSKSEILNSIKCSCAWMF